MNHNRTTCPVGTMPYTIRQGDTFFAIARTFGISLNALLEANPGIDPTRLYIGQVICVPTAEGPPSTNCPMGTTAYTIRAGDTFYDIAIRYNTTVDAIRRANPHANPNDLKIGQVICIP